VKSVAEHLEKEGSRRNSQREVDKFIRSAVNRYYYSMFLKTLSLARTVSGDSEKHIPHNSMPDHLKGGLRRTLLGQNSKRVMPLDQQEAQKFENRIYDWTGELAKILADAYDLRVVADYYPEVRVGANRAGNTYSLDGTKLSTVSSWARKIRERVTGLQKLRNQIHGK